MGSFLDWGTVVKDEKGAVTHVRTCCGIPNDFRDKPLSALCLSGGGIRSATFCLGVLQGLARKGLLSGFDYLSTVSGGGYIGAWLSALLRKERERGRNSKGAVSSTTGACVRDALEAVSGKLATGGELEADEIKHLREFSNFLTPRLGVFSLDLWTLVALFLRNLLLNWLILFPLLALPFVPLLAVVQLHDVTFGTLASAALVGAGLALGGVGVLYGVIDLGGLVRSNAARDAKAFVLCRLLPFLFGAILASIGWRALQEGGREAGQWVRWVAVFGGVHAISWAGASLMFSGGRASQRVGRVGAALASGMVTGLLLWFAVRGSAIIDRLVSDESLRSALWATFCPAIIVLGISVGSAVFAALTSGGFRDEDREWMGRSDALLMLAAAGWVAVGLVTFVIPASVAPLKETLQAAWSWLVGLVTAGGLGSGIAAAVFGNNAQTSAEADRRAGGFRRWFPSLLAVAFLVVLASEIGRAHA